MEQTRFNLRNVRAHMIQNGISAAKKLFQHEIQKFPGAFSKKLIPRRSVGLGFVKNRAQGVDFAVMGGQQKIAADKKIYFTRQNLAGFAVVYREEQDQKHISLNLVQVRPLLVTNKSFKMRLLKPKMLPKPRDLIGLWVYDVYPAQIFGVDGLDVHFGFRLQKLLLQLNLKNLVLSKSAKSAIILLEMVLLQAQCLGQIKDEFTRHLRDMPESVFYPSAEASLELGKIARTLERKRQTGTLTPSEKACFEEIGRLLERIASHNKRFASGLSQNTNPREEFSEKGSSVFIPQISNVEADRIAASITRQFETKVLSKLKMHQRLEDLDEGEREGRALNEYIDSLRSDFRPGEPFSDEDSQAFLGSNKRYGSPEEN